MINFRTYLRENFEDNYRDVRSTADAIAQKVNAWMQKHKHLPIVPVPGLRDFAVLFDLDEVDQGFPHIHMALIVGSPAGTASGFGKGEKDVFLSIPCLEIDDKEELRDLNRLSAAHDPMFLVRLATAKYTFNYRSFLSTFVHEFTHYIDYVRNHMKGEVGGPPDVGVGTGLEPRKPGTYERVYFNIGTEVNGFTDQMIDQFDKVWRAGGVEVRNVQDMLNVIKFTLPHSRLFGQLFHYATPRNRHRVMKRLADHFRKMITPSIKDHDTVRRSGTTPDMPSQRGWSLAKRREYRAGHLSA